MTTRIRLDEETEALLTKTANALNATKTDVLKAAIHDFYKRTLQEKSKNPYDLIADLIGGEFSGQGNLGLDGEEILRKAFRTTK
jgi:hypothetical protein